MAELIEHLLKGHPNIGVVVSHFFGTFPSFFDIGVKIHFQHGAALQSEGFANNQLNVGKALFEAVKQFTVDTFVGFLGGAVFRGALGGAVPGVVDPDENRDQIRFDDFETALPAVPEIGDAVAGDATVEYLEVVAGITGQQFSGGFGGVACAKGVDIVGWRHLVRIVFCTAGIGDGVALKEDGGIWMKFHRRAELSFLDLMSIHVVTGAQCK